MLKFVMRMLVLFTIGLGFAGPPSANERECYREEVEFEGVVDITADGGPLADVIEKGSPMRGRYRINSCPTTSGGSLLSVGFVGAIAPEDFEMEVGRVRFWPPRSPDGQVQLSQTDDLKSGEDTFDHWSIRVPHAEADIDLKDADATLILNLADDTHSAFDFKGLVAVPDLDRFGSSRFAVSLRGPRGGPPPSSLSISGELTDLRSLGRR